MHARALAGSNKPGPGRFWPTGDVCQGQCCSLPARPTGLPPTSLSVAQAGYGPGSQAGGYGAGTQGAAAPTGYAAGQAAGAGGYGAQPGYGTQVCKAEWYAECRRTLRGG